MTTNNIRNTIVAEAERLAFVDRLFGISYVLKLEPTVFSMAETLAPEYSGGYWRFHSLSNGGFYMSPRLDTTFDVSCDNGYEGKLSPDALGITACLYAYSQLSFGEERLAQVCAEQYHLLREYALDHLEARAIMKAID
jgi:hypothetical protein